MIQINLQNRDSHISYCFSVAQLCPTLCNPMDCSMPGFPVLHNLPEFAQTHSLNQWCHPTISSSVVPFFSCLQSFSASGFFLMSQLFTSGQNIGASALVSILQMNIQGWLLLGLTDLFAVQEALKSLFQHHTSKTSVLWCSAYSPTLTSIHDYWKTHSFDYMDLCQQSNAYFCSVLNSGECSQLAK